MEDDSSRPNAPPAVWGNNCQKFAILSTGVRLVCTGKRSTLPRISTRFLQSNRAVIDIEALTVMRGPTAENHKLEACWKGRSRAGTHFTSKMAQTGKRSGSEKQIK